MSHSRLSGYSRSVLHFIGSLSIRTYQFTATWIATLHVEEVLNVNRGLGPKLGLLLRCGQVVCIMITTSGEGYL
jgi:hypothetical protein